MWEKEKKVLKRTLKNVKLKELFQLNFYLISSEMWDKVEKVKKFPCWRPGHLINHLHQFVLHRPRIPQPSSGNSALPSPYSSIFSLAAVWLLGGILPNYAFLIFLIESKRRGVYDWRGEGKGHQGAITPYTTRSNIPVWSFIKWPLMTGSRRSSRLPRGRCGGLPASHSGIDWSEEY